MIKALLNRYPRISRLLLASLLAGGICTRATADSANETAVQTAFMFNFFKYIDWPELAGKQNTFSLCTTDDDKLGDSLSVLENKTVSGKPLAIRRGVSGKELKNCHIVFISASVNTASIIRELKGLPIVTVSEEANFIDQGGIIGFVLHENRLGFEINLTAANSDGLHISAQILKLAKRVNAEK